MRTSAQFNATTTCDRNPNLNISETAGYIQRASAQRQIVMRILQGEPIDDIAGELDSVLSEKGYIWENHMQKENNLNIYAARIKKMTDWELQHMDHIVFPDFEDEEKYTVDYFGEPVLARPDYIFDDPESGNVYVCKVASSKFRSETDDIQKTEAYMLGELGEKLYPDRNIVVRYLHLGSANEGTKKENDADRLAPFDTNRSGARHISELVFNEQAKDFFAAKHEEEAGHTCSGENCAGCVMSNVCNYEEPPISIDVIKQVRPIGELRLTRNQQDVTEYENGIARINAGAGAGKTLVVALRVARLIEKGYSPEDICLLTFTNAGAEEMAARVSNYCAEKGILIDPDKFVATTFNSFCMGIILEHYAELGFTQKPRVIPDEIKASIVNGILDRFPRIKGWNYSGFAGSMAQGYARNYMALFAAMNVFNEIKKEGYTRDNNPFETGDSHKIRYTADEIEMLFQMYDVYQDTLMERNMLEFDDQIRLVFRLVDDLRPNLFEELGFKHIIVDEFQDTDLPQIKLLQKMIDQSNFTSLMCVGDDSQSIFKFRHTSPEYMINFGNYFGQFDDFSLVENHRSNAATINFANKINELNEERVDKDLIATKPLGAEPVVKGFYSPRQEYAWIAEQIKERLDKGETASEIAVLASTKQELRKMASALTSLEIPSVMCAPTPFVENSRIAALCTFYDSFKTGSTRGFMDYMNARMHGAMKGMSSENIEEIVNNFKEEVQNNPKGLAAFQEYAKVLDEDKTDTCYQEFLERMSYVRDMDELNEYFNAFKTYGQTAEYKMEGKYEGVCLTTVHSAKGLEWDTTYLTLSGFDKLSYHRNTRNFISSGDKDENNRKWFVGATRAREELIMTGQFILNMNRDSCELNNYVKQAYDLLGRAYDYNFSNYFTTMASEKEAEISESQKKLEAMTTHSVGVMRGRGRLAGKTDENSAAKEGPHYAALEERARRARSAREGVLHTGTMTPEQIAEYNRMTAGAKQMTIDDIEIG